MPQKQETLNFSELFKLHDKQLLALQATKTYKYVLFGGTKGSGKSYFLRAACIYWLMRYFATTEQRHVRVGLFCEDYPALKDRHLSKLGTEWPKWLGKFHADHKEHGLCYVLAPEYGSGVIAFRNLDDVSKYDSSEFAAVFVDEIQRNPIKVFNTLRTRLRWPGIADVRFIAAGMPGGESYVADYWVDHNFSSNETEQSQFFFVQALPGDNPHLDPNYRQSLESLPEAERNAYLHGDFHAFDSVMDDGGWLKLVTPPELANAITEIPIHDGSPVLAIDPGAGGDNTSLVVRTPSMAEVVFDQKLKDTMAIVPMVVDLHRKRQFRKIYVDVVGVGKGVYDRLKELNATRHITVGVNFGAKARSDEKDTRKFFRKSYANLKAELFDQLREWLLHGGKLLKHPAWAELSTVKWKTDSDAQVKIMGKDEMRRKGYGSPNVADALAMTMKADDRVLASRPGSYERVIHRY